MAIVANVFVIGVKLFSDLRAIELNALLEIESLGISLSAPICLVIAAFLVVLIRKKLNIPRWHGPSDAIFAAHRTDNELDVKSDLDQHLPLSFLLVVVHLSDNMVPWSILGQRWVASLGQSQRGH